MPGPKQLVIRVKAAGVNPVDAYIRSGRYNLPLQLPYTPGFDGAGTVSAIGSGVTNWSKGDRVFIAGSLTGTYAEEAMCSVEQVFPLPNHLSYEQGAAIGIPYSTAYNALLLKAKAKRHETVLIHGASGGVGLAAVQLAKIHKMKIIASAGSLKGLELIKNQGADHVLNHKQPGYMKDILTFTNQKGVDVVLEMLANVNLAKDIKILATHGRIIIIGSRGSIEIDPRDIMTRDALISGMLIMNLNMSERIEILDAVIKFINSRQLNPIVGRIFPLAEARSAHEAIMMPGAYAKIVLIA